jgi:hypothetical protein
LPYVFNGLPGRAKVARLDHEKITRVADIQVNTPPEIKRSGPGMRRGFAMKYLMMAGLLAVLSLAGPAVASAQTILPEPVVGSPIAIDAGAQVWSSEPSSSTGQLFGQLLGSTPAKQTYLVSDQIYVAGFLNSQLWLKIVPDPANSDQSCAANQCWVHYGDRVGKDLLADR